MTLYFPTRRSSGLGRVLVVDNDVIAKRAEVRDTEWPERGIVESRRLRQIAGTETCVRKYTITGNNCHNNSPLLEIIEFFFESLSETACTTCANALAKPQFVPGVGADQIGRASLWGGLVQYV